MATDGVQGIYIETRDYGATSKFWLSLGFATVFETDHGSGQFRHPRGGPYIFISQQLDGELETHPILAVADSTDFAPDPAPEFARQFEPQHWDVVEAMLLDPDGRNVSLQAPVPAGVEAPNADEHHGDKYGSH